MGLWVVRASGCAERVDLLAVSIPLICFFPPPRSWRAARQQQYVARLFGRGRTLISRISRRAAKENILPTAFFSPPHLASAALFKRVQRN
jgi:hypothetical protein